MYKVIDVNTWERKKQFTWFNSFTNPCYGFNVEIDVTEVLNYSHETKTSFFINYLFLMMSVPGIGDYVLKNSKKNKNN